MIDLEFVERLIQALDESSLDTLELERGGTRVLLSKSPVSRGTAVQAQSSSSLTPTIPNAGGTLEIPAGQNAGAGAEASAGSPGGEEITATEPADNLIEVTSPMVGTFYRSPAPDAPSYVSVGDRVGTGTVLCIIEAMKLMNELESEVEGTIAKILVENAEPVEYGQVLFLLDPS
jgi:acetyl-CoA carboxylase biotin carboxyl carrier protein